MAVPAGPTEKRYVGNGVSTIFTVPFLVIQASDLAVYVDGVKLGSGYSQSGVGNPTSTVVFSAAPAINAQIVLSLEVPFERVNDYQENGDFLSFTVNRDFDRIWQALKQLLRFAGRALTLGQFDSDGQGWYRAKGNGIRNLRDPVEAQDAATKNWVQIFFGSLLGTITGNPNLASNIGYIFPNGMVRILQDLSGTDGATGIGLNNSNVGEQLSTLPLSKAVYDIIIVYGQSNSVGIGANLAGYPVFVHGKAFAYNPVAGTIIPLPKGLISSAGQTSTGHQYAAFANEYIKLTGRGVVIVSCGYGGTDIATLSKPGSPANTIYDKMLAAVADAQIKMAAAGLSAGNRYAIFNHGEQDALIGTIGSDYRAALNTLIGNMVTDLGLTRFGMSVLCSCSEYTAPGRVERIQRVQQEVARTRDDTVVLSRSQMGFSSANGMLQGDNVHYTQKAYNVLGQELGQSLSALIFAELSETQLAMRDAGAMRMNPRHIGQLTYARAKKIGASGTNTWSLYDDADSGGSYTLSNIEPTPAIFGSGIRLALQGRSPMLVQESIYIPKSTKLLEVDFATTITAIDAPNGLFGILCEPYISPKFAITSAGVISVPGATADVLAVINGAILVTVVSATVLDIAYKGGAGCYNHPMVSVNGASGSVVVSNVTLAGFRLTFATATSAIVSLQTVPLPAAALPAGAEFSIAYVMGSRLD